MSSIKLRSADGVLIDLEMDAAKFFRTLIKMMDDMGGTTDLEAIHLDRVKFAVLHKLVEWANYHKDDPEGSADGAAVVGNGASFGDWDAAFFAKQEPDSLCELIVAAVFLDFKEFLEMSFKWVGKMIKGKDKREILVAFGVEPDEEIFEAIEESKKK